MRSINYLLTVGNGCYYHIRHRSCQTACAAGWRAFIAEQRRRYVQAGGPMCPPCTPRRWLGVARHGDGCQLQVGLRATGYRLVGYNAQNRRDAASTSSRRRTEMKSPLCRTVRSCVCDDCKRPAGRPVGRSAAARSEN